VLNDLDLITHLASDLDSALGTLLGPEETALNTVLALISPSLNIDNLIGATSLETVMNKLTLGGGSTLDLTTLLGYLGVGSDTTRWAVSANCWARWVSLSRRRAICR
jgi:hypothetical protein